MKPAPDISHFNWTPGQGIHGAALARMRTHFRRPKLPMGEAWFMGESRRMFTELQGPLDDLPVRDLVRPLSEIASGAMNFGEYPQWRQWYHYLLAQTLPRCHEVYTNSLLEALITAFMALYPDEISPVPYPDFRHDALHTLGQCLMEPGCWNGSEIAVGTFLHRSSANPAQVWQWWDASGDFSASMFFCLRYVPASCIASWLHSVLMIPAPHWRAQVIVWLVGAHAMLNGEPAWPADFPAAARPSINWDWSHCLRPPGDALTSAPPPDFLPAQSRRIAAEVIGAFFTDSVLLAWLESISAIDYLYTELAEIPGEFERLWVRSAPA